MFPTTPNAHVHLTSAAGKLGGQPRSTRLIAATHDRGDGDVLYRAREDRAVPMGALNPAENRVRAFAATSNGRRRTVTQRRRDTAP